MEDPETRATPIISGSGGGDNEEDEATPGEDTLPDWTTFTKSFTASKDSTAHLIPFIPKRGEKDFEPLPPSSFSSSTSQLLSSYQSSLLSNSLTALFTALSSGSRHHSSRAPNSFTWRPELQGGRATCDGKGTFGIHFGSVGKYVGERKRIELRGEEVLFLVERGVVELWREGEDGGRVPMSVQETWSEVIGRDELTLERFLIYAYLKRLGYVVIRARPSPSDPPSPPRPSKAVAKPSFFSLLLKIFKFPLAIRSLLNNLVFPPRVQQVKLGFTRIVQKGEGVIHSLVGLSRWTSYDQIFRRLQIIPTGFDKPLPRGPLPHVASVLEPLVAPTPIPQLPGLIEQPYQVFWNVYKPVTKYKKSDPGEPDFQIVVINAATTSLPDIFEFVSMFEKSPFPPEPVPRPSTAPTTPAAAGPSSSPLPPTTKPTKPPAINPNAKPRPIRRPRPPSPPETFLQKYLPSFFYFGEKPKQKAPWKQSPYPKLKGGRRTVLIAVVDGGTTTFLKFGEGEFGKWSWGGGARKY